MRVFEFDYDAESGFAWIQVSGKVDREKWTVQCLLKSRSQEQVENGDKFELAIVPEDCGHDDGFCADVNEEAFDYWGENKCMKALFSYAKGAGLEVAGF